MNLWLDDIRIPPTNDYYWAKNVNEAIVQILNNKYNIKSISLDNDLGEYQLEGYMLLNWIEKNLPNNHFIFHIHTANPVARDRMKLIITHNNWILKN